MSLRQKTVLVTGGRGALGSVIAQRLAAEGARVAVTFLSTGVEKEPAWEKEAGVAAFKADMAVEKDVILLYDRMIRDYSRIDVVVNTVGGFTPAAPLAEVTVDAWDRMMSINLTTAFLSTREALRRMKGQSYGRIINISAMTGLKPTPGTIPYAISKAGVSLLTEMAAQENKGTGITVNAIAPSIILTPANLAWAEGKEANKWVKPEEIAEMVVYLCSPSAGAISGTTVKAFGGM